MRRATVRSRCECQASLVAELDESRQVVAGWAVDRHGGREQAQAHAIHPERDRFDIGWLCSICGRNTLRSFASDTLVYKDAPTTATA